MLASRRPPKASRIPISVHQLQAFEFSDGDVLQQLIPFFMEPSHELENFFCKRSCRVNILGCVGHMVSVTSPLPL